MIAYNIFKKTYNIYVYYYVISVMDSMWINKIAEKKKKKPNENNILIMIFIGLTRNYKENYFLK